MQYLPLLSQVILKKLVSIFKSRSFV